MTTYDACSQDHDSYCYLVNVCFVSRNTLRYALSSRIKVTFFGRNASS